MAEVSVCIPTYNGARYLRDCLDSVVNQSFRDMEIVVLDDHSEDETTAIAEEYASFDDRVHVHRNASNLGLVGNWNAAIRLARAPWVKLVFQDDFLASTCIAELHRFAEETGAGFIGCHRQFLFEDGVPDNLRQFYQWHQTFVAKLHQRPIMDGPCFAELCLDHFAQNCVGEPTVTLLHRSVFDTHGWFDAALSHRCDAEFWCRVGSNIGIAMVSRPLVTFRVHRSSASMGNYSGRSYANEILDPLLMLLLFLRRREYSSLREVGKRRGVLEKMERTLGQLASQAYQMACGAKLTSDAVCWAEWCRVIAQYPELGAYAHSATQGDRA